MKIPLNSPERSYPARRRVGLLPRLLAAAATIILLPGLSACIERSDAELRLDPKLAGEAQSWNLAGSFGGEARLSVDSGDPWQQRFEPGGFKRVAGVMARDGEVWVCDLGISRIQVFDPDGQFKRQYGQGVPLEPLLPSLQRLYDDNGKRKGDPSHWDTSNGQPWAGTEGQLFQIADLDVLDGHLWALDWARTGMESRFSRESGVRRFSLPDPWLGSQESLGTPDYIDNNRFGWPTYISCGRQSYAVSEPWGNVIRIYKHDEGKASFGQTDIATPFQLAQVLDARIGARSHPQYLEYLALRSNASGGPAKFDGLHGVCVAFDKILACDTNNARIQVFDGQTADRFYWGKLLRIFPASGPRGYPRFELPQDIDVGPDGTVYVLDVGRLEVAVLNSRFERIGSFGRGSLSTPWAIDLSDDGRHCYVSDREGNKVLHFVREESQQ